LLGPEYVSQSINEAVRESDPELPLKPRFWIDERVHPQQRTNCRKLQVDEGADGSIRAEGMWSRR
jgi:hypothetical protein